jgi:hypothetical protein
MPLKARFSAPVQTGTGAHPAAHTMGTGSFPGLKRPGRCVDHPPPSSAEVIERVELHLYYPLWDFMACFWVNVTSTLYTIYIIYIRTYYIYVLYILYTYTALRSPFDVGRTPKFKCLHWEMK